MHDWFASYDPPSSSWKTSQRSLVEGLETFSETWPRSGMMRGGTAYQLPPLAPLTAATGSGLLPTPEASNAKATAMRSGGRSPRNFLAPLPTKAFALGMVAKPSHSVPTPTASDHIVRECTSQEALNFETNKSVTLNRWVSMWPTPSASEDAAGTVNGKMQFMLTHAAKLSDPEATEAGGQLNPTWVEWLMGFPLGHTACMASATRSSRKSPKS